MVSGVIYAGPGASYLGNRFIRAQGIQMIRERMKASGFISVSSREGAFTVWQTLGGEATGPIASVHHRAERVKVFISN